MLLFVLEFCGVRYIDININCAACSCVWFCH